MRHQTWGASRYACASVGSIAEMQRFIRTEHTRNKLVQAFAGMLGLGDKVLGRMPLTKDYYKAIDAYLDAATGVADWGSAIQLSDTARTKLVASYTDGPCQPAGTAQAGEAETDSGRGVAAAFATGA